MNTRMLLSRFTSLAAVLVILAWGLPASAASRPLILATTTSTQDSGLLDVLIPLFEKESGYLVKTIAVGSGQAMAMGQKGRPTCCWSTRRMPRKSSCPKGMAVPGDW